MWGNRLVELGVSAKYLSEGSSITTAVSSLLLILQSLRTVSILPSASLLDKLFCEHLSIIKNGRLIIRQTKMFLKQNFKRRVYEMPFSTEMFRMWSVGCIKSRFRNGY